MSQELDLVAGKSRGESGDDCRFRAELLQIEVDLGGLTCKAVEILRLGEGEVDRFLLGGGEADVIDADNGHGALTILLVNVAANEGDAIADAGLGHIGEAATDEDEVAIGRGQVAAGGDLLGDQADRRLDLRFDADDADREGALTAADKAASLDATGS